MEMSSFRSMMSLAHIFTVMIILTNHVNSKPWKPATTTTERFTVPLPRITQKPIPHVPKIPSNFPRSCGKSFGKKSRIISGTKAAKGDWPWQASFYYGDGYLCGGILIDPWNVITAAHCMDQVDVGFVTVILGDYIKGIRNKENGEQRFRITKYVIHNEYDYPTTYTNDISIVHLDRPAIFTPEVQPACLPQNDPRPGKKCFVTGWGNTIFNGLKMSNVLLQTSLNILPWKECHSKNRKITTITDAMFCAANIKPKLTNHSACHGDSGGPLVCMDDKDKSWVVEGVVSWGSATCETSDAYTVFAKVSKFVQWIQQHKFVKNQVVA